MEFGGDDGAFPSLMEPMAANIEAEEVREMSDFGRRVQFMIDQFVKAKRQLDYANHPLRSLADWERRLNVRKEN